MKEKFLMSSHLFIFASDLLASDIELLKTTSEVSVMGSSSYAFWMIFKNPGLIMKVFNIF